MEKKVEFKLDNLNIEGIMYLPSKSGKFPGVIVLHPHPMFGGSMENNVVNAICEELLKNNVIAFKFNIRNPNVKKAIRYALAALDFFLKSSQLKSSKIGFCGYSWGSAVGLEAFYNDPRIKLLIGVSPPITMFNFSYLLESEKPKLITVGQNDQIIPLDKIDKFFENLKDPKEFATFNTDHIYMGVEEELSKRVIEFITEYL